MPRDEHPPAFLLYVKDILFDGKVEAMTTEEFGAYVRLLCMSWYEKPVATIPADDEVLARWTRLSPETWSKCRSAVLSPFKQSIEGRMVQPRLSLEYRKLVESKKKKSIDASKAAKAGWKKRKGDAAAMRPQCDGNAAAMRKDAIAFASSIKETPPLPPAFGGACADDSNSISVAEAAYSDTRLYVLEEWKKARSVSGLGAGIDRASREGARELAAAIDSGELSRESLPMVLRNGLADKNLPSQGLRGIARNYAKYLPSPGKPPDEEMAHVRFVCDKCKGYDDVRLARHAVPGLKARPCDLWLGKDENGKSIFCDGEKRPVVMTRAVMVPVEAKA